MSKLKSTLKPTKHEHIYISYDCHRISCDEDLMIRGLLDKALIMRLKLAQVNI